MSERNRKFWLCVFFMVLGIIIGCSVSGCKLKAAANGRFVTRILCFSVGDRECESAAVGSGGAPVYAEAHEKAIAYVNDEPLREPGLRPVLTYKYLTVWPGGNSYNESSVSIDAEKVTGDDGSILIKYRNSEWLPAVNRRGGTTISFANRHIAVEPALSGAYFYNMCCSYRAQLVPWNLPLNSICPICNDHYAWGGVHGSGSICGSAWQAVNVRPANYLSMNNKTQSEIDFLSDSQVETPDSGYSLVQAVWVKQMGSDGTGAWVKPVVSVFPVVYDTEPNKTFADSVSEWGYPYYADFMFTTADSIDISGMPFLASVKCNGKAGHVSARVIESSADGTRHIARTGGILPMDMPIEPTIYQVRTKWSDPNGHEDILAIEVLPDKPLEVECGISSQCIAYAAPYWLSDNKTMDLNGDGVVNLQDIQ